LHIENVLPAKCDKLSTTHYSRCEFSFSALFAGSLPADTYQPCADVEDYNQECVSQDN